MAQREPLHYRSYLLRCWEERNPGEGAAVWRFSLEDTHTGLRRGFTSLSELAAALQIELTKHPAPRKESSEADRGNATGTPHS